MRRLSFCRWFFLSLGILLSFPVCRGTVSSSMHDPAELREEFPYYAGRKAEYLGEVEKALDYYRLLLPRPDETLAYREGLKRLIAGLIDAGGYRDALNLSTDALDRFGRDPDFLVFQAEILLRLGKRRQALWTAHEAEDLSSSPRGLLVLAEASRRMGLSPWEDRLERLFLDYPAGPDHLKASEYLFYPLAKKPKDSLVLLIRGKAALASGSLEEALPLLKTYLEQGAFASPLLMREMGSLFRQAAGEEEGLVFFLELLEVFGRSWNADLRAAVHEQIGSLYLSAGRTHEAAEYLGSLPIPDEITEQAGRMLLSALFWTSGPEETLKKTLQILPSVRNPQDYEGVLDELTASLLRLGRWEDLRSLGGIVKAYGSPSQRSRSLYLEARALEEGFLRDGDPGVLFAQAVEADPRGYYGFLSGLRLSGNQVPDYEKIISPAGALENPTPTDEFLLPFFSLGMIDLGLEETYVRLADLSPSGAVKVAEVTAGQGRYLDSMRIMLRWDGLRSLPPGGDALKMLFPRWFLKEIAEAADRNDLPAHLFFALVREESAFQPDIRSWAGAAGLSQLMPSTASYVAELMSYGSYDLNDPADNAMIGAWYLALLRGQFPFSACAVAAYNAGPGRVGTWRRQFGTLPPDLFVEAIPVTETRRYVKKVLVSSVYYGYLYYAVDPRDTVCFWFEQL
ncbi:MAG: lytic transglycosylase domain-containing protein [Spirochaetales bacterium]|nr:lytic transglycosylase domain-containing protein [Spirochaetales bacterium]